MKSFTTSEKFLKSTSVTWLQPQAAKLAWYTPLHLILKIHLHFMHLQSGGKRHLDVFLHTCCFVITQRSFFIVSCHLLHDYALEWFKFSLKFLVSSSVVTLSLAIMAIVARSIPLLLGLLHNLVCIFVVRSMKIPHCLDQLWI